MSISNSDLDRIASLSNLTIPETEKENLTKQLNAILGYVKKLASLPTSSVEPTTSATDQRSSFREDICYKSNKSEKIIVNAPREENNFFVVPKI